MTVGKPRVTPHSVILRERSEPNGSHAALQRQLHEAADLGDPSTTLGMTVGKPRLTHHSVIRRERSEPNGAPSALQRQLH